MPLQNRVLPTGKIVAIAERGTMMGNRGGCLHDANRALANRRWVSRQWICCLLAFNNRHREVMTPGRYTELFFLDEATALAAGHRPCFECRRTTALDFAAHWTEAHNLPARPRAAGMDRILHDQRLDENGHQRRHPLPLDALPDAAMYITPDTGSPRIVLGMITMAWSPSGYHDPASRSQTATAPQVEVLTPPGTIAALRSGYRPLLHATAGVSR
jgi:hypothetical protein